jgi:hypothetical protein
MLERLQNRIVGTEESHGNGPIAQPMKQIFDQDFLVFDVKNETSPEGSAASGWCSPLCSVKPSVDQR